MDFRPGSIFGKFGFQAPQVKKSKVKEKEKEKESESEILGSDLGDDNMDDDGTLQVFSARFIHISILIS